MRTITLESKPSPVCCKFLQVRDIQLITQLSISVNRPFSRNACVPLNTHTRIHIHPQSHTPIQPKRSSTKSKAYLSFFTKIAIRRSQNHTHTVILSLKAQTGKTRPLRRCYMTPNIAHTLMRGRSKPSGIVL